MDWLDLLAVRGTLKTLLQHHSSKASILRRSSFFIVQLSHPYMTTRKTIALTSWTFFDKVTSLLFNMLSSNSWYYSKNRIPLSNKIARRSNQSILKEISPEYSLEGLILKLKLQYCGLLMRRTDSFEKTLMLGKIEGGRRRDDRG